MFFMHLYGADPPILFECLLLKMALHFEICYWFQLNVQEDIVGKLLDFLMAPHATTTVLLAEKDQVCFKDMIWVGFRYVLVSCTVANHRCWHCAWLFKGKKRKRDVMKGASKSPSKRSSKVLPPLYCLPLSFEDLHSVLSAHGDAYLVSTVNEYRLKVSGIYH